jgi:hypothetical protein
MVSIRGKQKAVLESLRGFSQVYLRQLPATNIFPITTSIQTIYGHFNPK